MKPTEFLNEGNAHCPKCDCNTTTTMNGKCKLCGTKKLDEKQVVEQQMLDVAAIYLEAKKQGDKETMLAAQQKLADLNEVNTSALHMVGQAGAMRRRVEYISILEIKNIQYIAHNVAVSLDAITRTALATVKITMACTTMI